MTNIWFQNVLKVHYSALSDLLGDEFVKFLDPNFESDGENLEEEADEEEAAPAETASTTTHSETLPSLSHLPYPSLRSPLSL